MFKNQPTKHVIHFSLEFTMFLHAISFQNLGNCPKQMVGGG